MLGWQMRSRQENGGVMKFTVTHLAAIAVACSAVPAAATGAVAATKNATKDATQPPPRPITAASANGSHDLNGVWARYPAPWPTYSADFDDVPPPDLGPDLVEPYAKQWKEQRIKRRQALAAGTPLLDPSTLCLPEGMPTVMQAIYPIQILQTPGQITVLAELFMQTRRIYMDAEMPPVDDLAPSYYGFSSGHWEGDTLVVKTRGVKTDVQFFEIPHSEAMEITERYQLADGGKKLYLDISIEDPVYLRTPYQFRWVYERTPGYRIPEYVCDNLHDVINSDGTVDLKTE